MAAVAIAVYLPTLTHGFTFDDGVEVVANEHIRSLRNLGVIFSSTGWSGAGTPLPWYRPLTTASYALNHAVSGLSPWSYHLANILLHALVTALVLVLARHLRWPSRAALTAALLFAVHPVHVEVVANVAGRKDLLATAFVVAAVLSHRLSVGRLKGMGFLPWAISGAVFSLGAMLSKETGAVTIGLLVLTDMLYPSAASEGRRRRLCTSYLLQAISLLVYLTLRWHFVHGLAWGEVGMLENPAAHAPLLIRLATGIGVIGRGLLLLFVPVRLSPDYSYDTIALVTDWSDPWLWGTAVALIAGFCFALSARHRSPAGLFCAGWYLLALLPASNLVLPIGTIFGERLLYLPSVAFCLATGLLAKRLLAEQPARTFWIATGAILAVLTLRTLTYAAVWQNDSTLFRAAADSNPASAKIQHRLALVLVAEGNSQEALEAYRRALEIYPGYRPVALNLGQLLATESRPAEAAEVYRQILTQRPADELALYRLATLYRDTGRLPIAVPLWQKILRRNADHTGSLLDLGTARYLQGSYSEAARLWQQAAASEPHNASAWYNLGLLYERLEQPARAVAAWQRFLETSGPEQSLQRAEISAKLEASRAGEREP